MPTIDLNLEGDGAWPELLEGHHVIHMQETPWRLAALEHGMASGAPSLALRLDLPVPTHEGWVVVAETSLAAWIAATAALRARFPQAFAGTPLE